MNRALLALAAAIALALSAAVAQATAEPPPVEVEFKDLSDAQRLRLLIQLAREGQQEPAAQLLQAFPFSGPLARNRTLFVEGLIDEARGDLDGAIAKYRAVLASDPKLTMVRAQLAQALYAKGEDDGAKHHLELLMSEAPDQGAANSIKSFIDQIDARRPYRISAYISLAPTTNMTGGTSTDVIYFNGLPFQPDNKAKSGTGLTAGVNVGYTHDLGNQWAGVFGFGLNGQLYQDSAFNQATASETVELRRLTERGYWGVGAVSSQTASGSKADFASWTAGPRFSAQHYFSPKLSALSISTLEFKTYNDQPIYDGWTASEYLTLTYAFRQDLAGFLFAGIDRNQTDYAYLDSWSPMIGVGAYRELPWGVTTNADGRLRYSGYDGEWQGFGVDREDWRIDTATSLTKRDWDLWGYAPVIEYSYTRIWSNIDIYDSHAHTVDFRLTKEF